MILGICIMDRLIVITWGCICRFLLPLHLSFMPFYHFCSWCLIKQPVCFWHSPPLQLPLSTSLASFLQFFVLLPIILGSISPFFMFSRRRLALKLALHPQNLQSFCFDLVQIHVSLILAPWFMVAVLIVAIAIGVWHQWGVVISWLRHLKVKWHYILSYPFANFIVVEAAIRLFLMVAAQPFQFTTIRSLFLHPI